MDKKGLRHHRLTYAPPDAAGQMTYVADIQDYYSPKGDLWRVMLWNTRDRFVVQRAEFTIHDERKAISQAVQWLAAAALGYWDKREKKDA